MKAKGKTSDRFTWRSYAAVGAALLVLAFFLIRSGTERRHEPERPTPVAAGVNRPAAVSAPSAPTPPGKPETPAAVKTKPAAKTNASPFPSVTDSGTKEELQRADERSPRVRAAPSSSRRRVVFADGTEGEIGSRPLFRDRGDSAVLGAARPGGMTSGLRAQLARLGDEGFLEMLRRPVEPADPSDDYAREMAAAVTQFKRDLLAYIEQGATPQQAVAELSARSAEERKMRVAAIRQLNELTREGDADTVKKYVEEVNALFAEQGMAPLRQKADVEE